jgi:F0F1-type ATP synthase membrane subunit c/vacuolar-type H+-ATPase subunit K
MPPRQSAAVDRALARIAAGQTAYAAAKSEGIALSTIYRALARQRAALAEEKRP